MDFLLSHYPENTNPYIVCKVIPFSLDNKTCHSNKVKCLNINENLGINLAVYYTISIYLYLNLVLYFTIYIMFPAKQGAAAKSDLM